MLGGRTDHILSLIACFPHVQNSFQIFAVMHIDLIGHDVLCI